MPSDLDVELVVVDNGSTDNTRQIVEQGRPGNMPLRYLLEAEKGQCRARNRGAFESESQVLLFTDDDVRVPSNWVEAMSRPILNGEADAVAGGVKLADSLERNWMTDFHRGLLAATHWMNPEAIRIHGWSEHGGIETRRL